MNIVDKIFSVEPGYVAKKRSSLRVIKPKKQEKESEKPKKKKKAAALPQFHRF